jgi:hypothetical protein
MINEVSRLKKLAGILKENAEQPEKIVIAKGGKIRGYSSNGEHYVLLYPDRWTFYTGDGKELATGKINVPADADYLRNLAAQ